MFAQLKMMFPNLITITDNTTMDTVSYKWYVTSNNEIIGIPKTDLTQREKELLEILLTPYKANQPPTTDREKMWMDVLFHHEFPKQMLQEKLNDFHFVYFSLSDETIDPESFREAIHGLFPTKTPILWENNHEGVIIQEETQNSEDFISYSEIIEVLTTDFYMNIKLFIGPTIKNIKQAPDFYYWIKRCYHLTTSHNHDVMRYTEAIPYLFLQDINDKEQQLIIESLLNDVKEDEELLKTVQVFLESNSNTTLAAKKMYMHRNSLQYRVDKFIEKTGIDVKQFEGAIAIYLCLIMRTKW
ncbi:PucR family transcriptional regulator [Gracilibacillus kekensis]|uniref:PucR C-terminal helix-turn-helix domain-containing protein n=1 Tax=Gracilibacillus kekensis TaxID=1027249 RepID=A0A1M7J6W9_9BACI|nr:helix-turn-helix domain-containing protein [Gracilibacillus kekensis]SHM48197.1 PucR C-terminal helix-turn-helix domain-containing protein [Gracilibacillus kekensis]